MAFLHTLATLDPQPDSVPINVLSKVEGTPLADQADVPVDETVRVIATARIIMPGAVIRLAAGRHLFSFSDQALCFMAGVNSIFSSEDHFMLTEAVPCNDHLSDRQLLDRLGLRAKVPAGARGEARPPVSIRVQRRRPSRPDSPAADRVSVRSGELVDLRRVVVREDRADRGRHLEVLQFGDARR